MTNSNQEYCIVLISTAIFFIWYILAAQLAYGIVYLATLKSKKSFSTKKK